MHTGRKRHRVPREGTGWRGRGGATGSGLPPLTPLSPLQRRKAPHEGVYNVSRGPISLGELGEGREEGRLRPRPASPLREPGARLLRWPHLWDCCCWSWGSPDRPRAGWCRQAGRARPVARSWSPPSAALVGRPSPPRCGSDGRRTLAGRPPGKGAPRLCSWHVPAQSRDWRRGPLGGQHACPLAGPPRLTFVLPCASWLGQGWQLRSGLGGRGWSRVLAQVFV